MTHSVVCNATKIIVIGRILQKKKTIGASAICSLCRQQTRKLQSEPFNSTPPTTTMLSKSLGVQQTRVPHDDMRFQTHAQRIPPVASTYSHPRYSDQDSRPPRDDSPLLCDARESPPAAVHGIHHYSAHQRDEPPNMRRCKFEQKRYNGSSFKGFVAAQNGVGG